MTNIFKNGKNTSIICYLLQNHHIESYRIYLFGLKTFVTIVKKNFTQKKTHHSELGGNKSTFL